MRFISAILFILTCLSISAQNNSVQQLPPDSRDANSSLPTSTYAVGVVIPDHQDPGNPDLLNTGLRTNVDCTRFPGSEVWGG